MSYTNEGHFLDDQLRTRPDCVDTTSVQEEQSLTAFPVQTADTLREFLYTRLGLQGEENLSTEILLSCFFSSDWQIRVRAIRGLGYLGDDPTGQVKRALTSALTDNSEYVRAVAAQVLAQYGIQMPKTDLLLALRDSSWRVRAAVLATLGTLAQCDPDQAPIETFLYTFEEDPDPTVRAIALNTLAACNAPELFLLISQTLQDDKEEPLLLLSALHLLEQQEHVPAELLLSLFNNQNEEIRREALRILGQKKKLPMNSLIRALNDPFEEIRLDAIRFLEECSDDLPIEQLLYKLKDPDQRVQDAVSRFLRKHDWLIPARISSDVLLTFLQSEKRDDLRALAAWALGEQKAEQAEAALLRAIHDPSGLVRTATLQALRQFEAVELMRSAESQVALTSFTQKGEQPSRQDMGTQLLASLANALKGKQGSVWQEWQDTPTGQMLLLFYCLQGNEGLFQGTIMDAREKGAPIEYLASPLDYSSETPLRVITHILPRLADLRWTELFVTCLHLHQDHRIQLAGSIPMDIVLCGMNVLALPPRKEANVPVLREILAVLKREAICDYSFKVSSQMPLDFLNGENTLCRIPHAMAPFSAGKVDTWYLGHALETFQVWYDSSQSGGYQPFA